MSRYGHLRGLGDSAQAQGATQYAAMGAKAGSIVPGIGTVIGAVVGAVVGWLAGKKPPPRPSAAQIAECKKLYSEYMGYAAQMPNQPIPLEKQQLIDLNWCFDALYGSEVALKDPRWFTPDVEGIFIPLARQLVRKIYETPVGASIAISSISVRDPKGRTLTFSGSTFVNPTFTDLKTFSENYFQPMLVKVCEDTIDPRQRAKCTAYYSKEEFKRFCYDLLAWAARTELPNISEADLKAASQIAATVPGSSAKDVVTAVEQIIGRTVARGETAAVLTPATGPPPVLPIVPTGTPTNAPPASGIVPPTFAEPLIPPAATLPAPMPMPFPALTPAAYSPLAPVSPRGSFIVPVTTSGTVPGFTEKSLFENPFVIGGSVLALGLLFMMNRRRRA